MSPSKPVEPATFAEGSVVPAVPESIEERQARTSGVPTRADREREWNTYRALVDLTVGTSTAVAAGNPVPASHPYLRDSDERGPGWVSQGAVELTGAHDAPEDLTAVHAEFERKQAKDAQG